MNIKSRSHIIVIEPLFVSINEFRLEDPPNLELLREVLEAGTAREFSRGAPYLPVAIFDELGIAARYHAETRQIALIDIYMATSQSRSCPACPFTGTVVLNGARLTRPVLMKAVKKLGDLVVDNQGALTGGVERIGVSITAKFEYVGVINFGWQPV